jgi:adenine deaminase
MVACANEVIRIRGGLAAVVDGEVIGSVSLPVAGLMSPKPVPEIALEVEAFGEAVRKLGVWASRPALAMAGFALPVSPETKLTDLGLVDVATQTFIPLFP